MGWDTEMGREKKGPLLGIPAAKSLLWGSFLGGGGVEKEKNQDREGRATPERTLPFSSKLKGDSRLITARKHPSVHIPISKFDGD